ncbi:hypothetical protein KIL84_018214 [Mauremys mutica]|uniref:Uncharacterized protein n=1 Tax=Mauremys mutica TaxID=74926 RepID=A0A9D3XUD4_9SAUR|nr:hypothetical protein KIL84_018214 [Mauremys mutica]
MLKMHTKRRGLCSPAVCSQYAAMNATWEEKHLDMDAVMPAVLIADKQYRRGHFLKARVLLSSSKIVQGMYGLSESGNIGSVFKNKGEEGKRPVFHSFVCKCLM